MVERVPGMAYRPCSSHRNRTADPVTVAAAPHPTTAVVQHMRGLTMIAAAEITATMNAAAGMTFRAPLINTCPCSS